jgi:hypothetical protein
MLTTSTEASVQNVAAKKTYTVPVVAERVRLAGKTFGVPSGVGEPSIGLLINGDV